MDESTNEPAAAPSPFASRLAPFVTFVPVALAVAVLLAAAIAAHVFLSHGLRARWRVDSGGETITLARTIEHRTAFPEKGRRALSRYVQSWDFDRLGLPGSLPAINAVLDGVLTVPPGPPRILSASSPNQVTLFVDGREGKTPLAPGNHPFELTWRGDFAKAASLELRWAREGQTEVVVPRDALRPPGGAPVVPRLLLWLGALGAMALAVLALARPSVRRDPARWRRASLAALGTGVVALGLALRLFDYDVMPDYRENDDELFATWNGWQLLENGTTRGWTAWPEIYDKRVKVEHVNYFDHGHAVITPFLEYPALFHLLPGAAAKLGGAKQYFAARLRHTRLVPIALQTVAMVLMLFVGRRLFPRSLAAPFLGVFVYAVLPVTVLQGRVIKEEALLVALSLASLLFFLRWRDDGRKQRELLLGALAAGLCASAKPMGLGFLIAYLLLAAAEIGVTNRTWWRDAVLPGSLAASLGTLHGALTSYGVWRTSVVKQATHRPSVFSIFARFFDLSHVNMNAIGRGWLIFLWVAFATAVGRGPRRTTALLAVPLFAYIVLTSLSVGTFTFGWYQIPMYPFLCLGVGKFLADAWRRPDVMRGAPFVVLFVLYTLAFTFSIEYQTTRAHWPHLRYLTTVTTLGMLTPFFLVEGLRRYPRASLAARTGSRLVLAGGLATFLIVSANVILQYDVFFDGFYNFDRPNAFFP